MSKNLSFITRGACHTSPSYENVECIGTCVMAFPFSGGSRTDLRGQGYEDSAWFFLSSSVPLTHPVPGVGFTRGIWLAMMDAAPSRRSFHFIVPQWLHMELRSFHLSDECLFPLCSIQSYLYEWYLVHIFYICILQHYFILYCFSTYCFFFTCFYGAGKIFKNHYVFFEFRTRGSEFIIANPVPTSFSLSSYEVRWKDRLL